MAGYYGVIQSIVKRGYDAFQVTFRVHRVADGTSRDAALAEMLVYRVDVALDGDKLILFPDRELGKCLNTFQNPSEQGTYDIDLKWKQDVSRIANRLCQHVSALLFESSGRTCVGRPA